MHKQDNTNRDKGLESIMESMYSEAGASDHVPPHDPDKLKRAKERGYDDEGGGLFSTVAGDPNEWEIGQIIPSAISSDDYDGIILSIGEENGERTFDVMQVGEEGWTIYTSNLNLPDDDTGRVPPDALPGSNPIGV